MSTRNNAISRFFRQPSWIWRPHWKLSAIFLKTTWNYTYTQILVLWGLVFLVQNIRISRNTEKIRTQGWGKFHVITHPKLLIWYDYYTFLNSWDNRLSEILHSNLPAITVLEQYKLLWFEKWKNTPCCRHFEFFGQVERNPEFGSRVEFFVWYTSNVQKLVFLAHLRYELQTCKVRTLKTVKIGRHLGYAN